VILYVLPLSNILHEEATSAETDPSLLTFVRPCEISCKIAGGNVFTVYEPTTQVIKKHQVLQEKK
jgi:hypothetical protein